jgi:hypothetical protein
MTDTAKWTDVDQERLAALIAEGVSGIAIAKELGRTHTAIRSQAKKLRLKFGRAQRGPNVPKSIPHSTSYNRLFGD